MYEVNNEERQRGKNKKKVIAHQRERERYEMKGWKKKEQERERERSAMFKEPTVVKEPSSSPSRHAQVQGATFRADQKGMRLVFSLSVSFSFFPPCFLSFPLSHRRSKFISRSCLFWTFHNIWPHSAGGHRSPKDTALSRLWWMVCSPGCYELLPPVSLSLSLRLSASFSIRWRMLNGGKTQDWDASRRVHLISKLICSSQNYLPRYARVAKSMNF